MLKYLIYIGLSITPFLVIGGMDSRQPKDILTLWLAAAIALVFIFKGGNIICKNKWLIAFVAWVIAITPFAPKWLGLDLYGGGNVDALWAYKSIACLVIYFIAFIAISNMPISTRVIETSIMIIAYVGFLMSILGIFQFFRIDPFFKMSTAEATPHVPSHFLAGTMGHPTMLAQFMLMCIPAAIYLKKWWAVIPMLFIVIVAKSDVAYLAAVCAIIFYLSFGSIVKMLIGGLIVATGAIFAYVTGIVSLSGRLEVWILALQDMKNNPFTFFSGFGFGSWPYIFKPLMHSNIPYWVHAHNDYLEVFYGVGVIGLFLLFMMIFNFFKSAWSHIVYRNKILLTILIVPIVCALGNFVFHTGVFSFYSLVIAGIISNQIAKKEQVCTV